MGDWKSAGLCFGVQTACAYLTYLIVSTLFLPGPAALWAVLGLGSGAWAAGHWLGSAPAAKTALRATAFHLCVALFYFWQSRNQSPVQVSPAKHLMNGLLVLPVTGALAYLVTWSGLVAGQWTGRRSKEN